MTTHTPTPWRLFTNKDGTKLVGIGDKDGQGILDAGFGVWSWNDPEGIANAKLVVEAVNSHEALKADIARLSGEVELARRAIENAAGRFNLLGGVGLVNGCDPKVGYREMTDTLKQLSRHQSENTR